MILATCITCTVINYYIFFAAIDNVETPPGMAVSYPAVHIGNFQISYEYWLDSDLPGRWEYCLNDEYARWVMLSYWRRYAHRAMLERDFETLARIHYGGPDGADQKETEFYWELIKKELKNESSSR